MFKQLDYNTHQDLKANLAFYLETFHSTQKEFDHMSQQEQEDFKNIARGVYYPWLNLTEEIVSANPQILQTISLYIIEQQRITYLANIKLQIDEASRSSSTEKITLDPGIMRNNQSLLDEMDHKQLEIEKGIRAFANTFRASKHCNKPKCTF